MCFHIHKVRSHREYSDAVDLDDLHSILGNTLADETAKIMNTQDIVTFREAANSIHLHSKRQISDLLIVHHYLCELNSLHSALKIEKE